MSDEKRFQKTFTRRKKEACNDAEDHVAGEDTSVEEELLVSSAESQGEGSECDLLVSSEPIANGSGNVTGKQKRKGEEEQLQQRKQKKQKTEDLKMKPKQKGKKQIAKEGKKELKKNKKEQGKEDDEPSAECRFPLSRVDRIIRSEASDYRITHEAVFLINKASEKFLEIFCRGSYKCAEDDRKNYVSYNHLSTAVSKDLRFDFLSDYVPEKVKADKALAEQISVEK